MAIRIPGKRDRHGSVRGVKRSVVAVLSLTAMVDLFTVLVVFLLQNYATTGEAIHIPKGVELPNAYSVKELKPSNVVIVSREGIQFNDELMASYDEVSRNKDWMLLTLKSKIAEMIEKGEVEKTKLKNRIRTAVRKVNTKKGKTREMVDEFRKITIQADRQIDFLTVKKVMYTLTESEIYEINFAVIKNSAEIDTL